VNTHITGAAVPQAFQDPDKKIILPEATGRMTETMDKK